MIADWFNLHRAVLLILGLTVLVYGASLQNGFVTLDDPSLVYENRIVMQPTLGNMGKSFAMYDPELYVPLTFLSYQIESAIFGMDAWHFHLVNLLLHMIAVCLVYMIVLRIGTGRIATLTALLFAVHPLNSEAVLWISARKDLLSSVFTLASVLAYLHYREHQSVARWAACFLLFLFALLSKVMAVTLPVVLILIDWLLEARIDRRSLKEKLPFFALSVVFLAVAIAGKTHIIANESITSLLLMAPRSAMFYVAMLVQPVHQSVVHLYESPISVTSPVLLLSLFTMVAVTVLCWRAQKWNLLIAFGWAWFLITLSPTFIHYSRGGAFLMLASERYAYVPAIGLFIIVAVLLEHARQWRMPLIVLIVIACSALSVQRTNVFADGITLSRDILRLHPDDALTHYNLGSALDRVGRTDEALVEYRRTMELRPGYANAYINAAIILADRGAIDEAVGLLKEAVRRQPTSANAHYNLGVAFAKRGETDRAIEEYREAIGIVPEFPLAHKSLAEAYGKKKMYAEAIAEYEILAELDPTFARQLNELKASLR